MKLDTPVVFNEKIRPICLPSVFTATPTKHAVRIDIKYPINTQIKFISNVLNSNRL